MIQHQRRLEKNFPYMVKELKFSYIKNLLPKIIFHKSLQSVKFIQNLLNQILIHESGQKFRLDDIFNSTFFGQTIILLL